MTFHVSLASTHIVNLYLGKASDAADHEADWLQPTTDTVTYSDGTSEEVYGFDIPVTAVDTDFDLAILGTKASGTTMSSACVMPWKRLRKPRPRQTAPTPVM